MKQILMVMALAVCMNASASGQDEMQMMEDIKRLQHVGLKSQRMPERDQAEKELIAMGEFVLDQLDIPEPGDDVDYRERVARVRSTLEKIAVKRNTRASKIKLPDGKISVQSLLKTIKEQSGNDVTLGQEVALETANREIEFKAGEYEFWDVLNELLSQAKLRIDPYDGEQGQLALADVFTQPGAEAPTVLADASSVMRFQVTSVSSHRSFMHPNQSTQSIDILIRWEPRITPIAIDLPLNSIKIVDEFDRAGQSEQEGTFSGIVTPDIPELEFSLNTSLFDRQIEEIKSLSGTVSAVLPGRTETFKFKDVANLDPETSQTKAGAKVTYGGIDKNEDLWGLSLSLSFDEENNALESHQGWVFNNELFLVNEEGEKFFPIGSETFQQSNEMVGILYYFADDPKGMDLHYKTPAAVVKVDIPFVIKGIPLP